MESEISILAGVVMGSLARLYMLRIDYRQFPSYPQGYVIHLSLGIIASFLGAVAIPAISSRDFAAATFLALAATQFREVRKIERESLMEVEETELIPRGGAYIEGIARVFEARNYLAMLTALIVNGVVFGLLSLDYGHVFSLGLGALAGLVAILILNRSMVGQVIEDIALVRPARIEFDGPLLKVAGVVIMNVGLPEARKVYLEKGAAVEIVPRNPNAKATLQHIGQRQAIAHDASTLVGIQLDIGEQEFTPLVRRNHETGALVMAIIPGGGGVEALIEAVKRVPVLEATVRKPLKTKAARMVD